MKYKYKKCARCGKYNGTFMKNCKSCRDYMRKFMRKMRR